MKVLNKLSNIILLSISYILTRFFFWVVFFGIIGTMVYETTSSVILTIPFVILSLIFNHLSSKFQENK